MAKSDLTPKKERQGLLQGSAIVAFIVGYLFLSLFLALHSVGFDFRFDALLASIVAAYPLYTVWRFRNEDKQEDIENTRVETQIKDFHEVEKWATDTKLTETNPALRIAAIHQLRPYLEGEHGDAFQRPAYEIYKALLAGWKKLERDEDRKLSQETIAELKKLPIHSYIEAIHTVIREILKEKGAWRKVFPNETRPLRNLNLLYASLGGAHLEGTFLLFVHLEGADLLGAHLEGAQLIGAHLEGACLLGAHLEGANLSDAQLDYTTRFDDTVYDDTTRWWDGFSKEKADADNRFIHIDAWTKQMEERRKAPSPPTASE